VKPLIVGIDPGSTSAVAAVDLEGNIELLESGKNFPPREIIQRIVKVGKPVIVASDKAKTPSKVEKIASSVGAEIYEPENDLSSERKKELGKGANSHELDAVASAVNAQKQLQRDIRKINKYNNKTEIPKEKIAKRIFKDQPIQKNNKKEEKEDKEQQKTGQKEEKGRGKEDLEKKRLRRRVENLEDQVHELKSRLGEKESENQNLKDRIEELKEEDREDIIERREVKKREAIIGEKNDEIQKLEEKVKNHEIREKQYRKAISKIFEKGYRPVRLVDEDLEVVPDEAVTKNSEVFDKLEKRGSEIHMIEDVEGIELREFIVVDELPDKEDFESVIKDYREERR
jgi:predicted RNase H-like nuclease (RuvC/YqgF family)